MPGVCAATWPRKNADYDIAAEQYNTDGGRRDCATSSISSHRSRAWASNAGSRRTALATAQEAYDLALLRYREGIGNYLQVLSVEAAAARAAGPRRGPALARAALSINLIRALGGGCEEPKPASPRPAS